MQALRATLVSFAGTVALVAGNRLLPTGPLPLPLPLQVQLQLPIEQRGTTQTDTLLTATLTGSELVGRAGPPNASGGAVITLRPVTNEVCYRVVFRGIVGTAAHIHKGAKGQNGPVSVPFAAPTDSAAAGCARVDASLLTDIGTNPTNYYVNVHTAELPQGAIRGQLGKPLARGG